MRMSAYHTLEWYCSSYKSLKIDVDPVLWESDSQISVLMYRY